MKPLIFLLIASVVAVGQVPDPAPAPAPQGSSGGGNSGSNGGGANAGGGSQSNFLGKDVPFFDPGSEVVTWDGRNWNISNNRLFLARFEKYLNAPEETSENDLAYNAIVNEIMDLLAPGRQNTQSLDQAFKLLPKASEFEQDANQCDNIANAVYSAWLAKRSNNHLLEANKSLEEEKKRLEWNARITARAQDTELNMSSATNSGGNQDRRKAQMMRKDVEMAPILSRIMEVNTLLKSNQLKKEIGELQSKIEFQALIVQLFMQRRFRHVLIATRFYRAIFNDGDSQLRVGEDAKSLFSKTSGMPPTVSTLDSMASEIIRDVREGVQAFTYLMDRQEAESATKRLGESFIIGEYMPEIRTLPREEKRRALNFVQQSNRLLSALEVKDYALAESIVKEMETSAKDFDNSKPMAAIETAKTIAAMHIAKAKNAAVAGDRETLETELRAATEIWPRNPALAEVSGMIFSQADVQQKALVDFDQLVGQKNYRQIYDDQVRFIAATALYPEKQDALKTVLENIARVEGAIIRAQEIEKRGDYAGAWESTEKAYLEFPDDSKLNSVRASLTTKAADFVQALKTAEELEQKKQIGSSLAWYLKAQQKYPPSEFAREGISRLIKEVLPDAS